MQATQAKFTVPASTEIPIGIIVRTDFCIYRGQNCYRAIHQRDGNTVYKTVVQSPGSDTGHQAVLTAWVATFTGPNSDLGANYQVAARGSDWNGYYWVLVPTF